MRGDLRRQQLVNASTLPRSETSTRAPVERELGDSAYRVGPFQVRPEGWPADWHDYAQQEYPRLDLQGGSPLQVVIEANAIHDREWNVAEPQRLSIERDGKAFVIEVPDAFTARYEADRLEVTSLSRVLGPHFTLCNALRAVCSVAMPLQFDGLMLHAGCGILNGRGVLVCGKSGAGKTTISLGMKKTTYISDDISLVESVSSAPILLGSPFYGSRGVGGAQIDSPLAVLGVLGQSLEGTDISPLAPAQLIPELLRHVVCFTTDKDVVAANLERVMALADHIFVARVMRDLRDSADTVVEMLLDVADDHRRQTKGNAA